MEGTKQKKDIMRAIASDFDAVHECMNNAYIDFAAFRDDNKEVGIVNMRFNAIKGAALFNNMHRNLGMLLKCQEEEKRRQKTGR